MYRPPSFVQEMPGYVSIITAEDIPSGGQNNFVPLVIYQPEQVSVPVAQSTIHT